MFHLFRKKKDKYIILFIIFVLSTISVAKHKDMFIRASMDPYSYLVESSITKLKFFAGRFFSDISKSDAVKQKHLNDVVSIEELKWQNSIYRKQLDSLSRLFPLKLNFSFAKNRFLVSQVVARDINYNGRFWINLGKSDNVVAGTPIITKNLELVGTVKKVSDSKSSVWSILTKDNVIDAIDSATNGWGIYYGKGKPTGLYTYFSDKPLSIGDIIKTSGLDGKYPKDIIIGKVTKIIETDPLKTVAEIKPAALPGASLYLIAITNNNNNNNDMGKSSSAIHSRNSS